MTQNKYLSEVLDDLHVTQIFYTTNMNSTKIWNENSLDVLIGLDAPIYIRRRIPQNFTVPCTRETSNAKENIHGQLNICQSALSGLVSQFLSQLIRVRNPIFSCLILTNKTKKKWNKLYTHLTLKYGKAAKAVKPNAGLKRSINVRICPDVCGLCPSRCPSDKPDTSYSVRCRSEHPHRAVTLGKAAYTWLVLLANPTRRRGSISALFLCVCAVPCKHRPCEGPIPRPRSPTKCLQIRFRNPENRRRCAALVCRAIQEE
jgi:hypothetical protein